MKKFVSVFLIFVLVFSLSSMLCSLCACTDDSTTSIAETNITEEDAREIATEALRKEISIYFSDRYDLTKTQYVFDSTYKYSDGAYSVKGKFILYDKYGDYCPGYEFSVLVNPNGYATVNYEEI